MIEIIPAIDIIDGKCVRLSEGDFSQKKIYSENPAEIAKEFEQAGIRRLHLVDLDGAKNGKVMNLEVLKSIAKSTDLIIDFSGGIKSDEDIEMIFDAGASIAGIGSIAVKEPGIFFGWLEKYGNKKLMLGADVRNGKLAINGWQTATEIEIIPFLESYAEKGISQIFCTDISKDGLLTGTGIGLYQEILGHLPAIDLIASGGVSNIADIDELEEAGCAGVIIGKAIYEGKIKLEELNLNNAG
jgi:phosphoribosylformimino-5-aminoimidazole carboxamide ribotide isomerase